VTNRKQAAHGLTLRASSSQGSKTAPSFGDVQIEDRPSGTAQRITSYSTFITGPAWTRECISCDRQQTVPDYRAEFVEALTIRLRRMREYFISGNSYVFRAHLLGAISLVTVSARTDAAAGPTSLPLLQRLRDRLSVASRCLARSSCVGWWSKRRGSNRSGRRYWSVLLLGAIDIACVSVGAQLPTTFAGTVCQTVQHRSPL